MRPDIIVSVLPTILGVVLIVNGIAIVQIALETRLELDKWWIILIVGVCNTALGIIAMLNPFTTMEIIMMFVGICLIFAGACDIFSLLLSKKVIDKIKQAAKTGKEEYNEID